MDLTAEQKRTFEGTVRKISKKDEEQVLKKYDAAEEKAQKRGADPSLLDGVKTLWRMLIDPDYTISWETKAWIIFALAYFISPVDLIPDFIPVVGYADDAVVVMWVLHHLHEEVVEYRRAKGLSS